MPDPAERRRWSKAGKKNIKIEENEKSFENLGLVS